MIIYYTAACSRYISEVMKHDINSENCPAHRYFIPWRIWWRICGIFMVVAYLPTLFLIDFDNSEAWKAIVISFPGNCFLWYLWYDMNSQLREGKLVASWLPKPMDSPEQTTFEEKQSPGLFYYTLYSVAGTNICMHLIINAFLAYGYCYGLYGINILDYFSKNIF